MKINKFHLKSTAISALLSMALVGCGGGSSSSSTDSNTIGGTTAIGAGIYAQIEVLDTPTCTTFTSTSDSNGTWSSGDLSGTSGPYLIRASSSIGFNMYSYIDVSASRTANITPLTYYVTDSAARNIAGRSIADMYGTCNNGTFTGLTSFDEFETGITTSLNTLNSNLENAGYSNTQYANFNHFNGPFEANQTGYDALLDEIDMSMNNNTTIIRTNGQILETSDDEITTESTQTLTGNIVDSTSTGITGVTVTIKKDDLNQTVISTLTSDSNGEYTKPDLESYREYILTFEKEGYTPVSLRYNTFSTSNPSTVTMFTEAESSAQEVTPSINIINSRNGDVVSDVIIKVRNGLNNRLGEILTTTSSNEALSLRPGVYTFELIKNGYQQKFVNKNILDSTTNLNFDLLSINNSSSINSNAFATIILRWQENPSDLDSHTLLTIDNTNVDVYFANRQYGAVPQDRTNPCATSGVIASLDLDDTTSYGPETTTICDGTKGPFDFKVHHYAGTSNIGNSPTSVELITRDGSRYEFTAPTTGFTGDDNVWNVFTIDTEQNVTTNNTIEENSSSLNSINDFTLENNMIENKTFRITHNDNNGYVDFIFNENGTGLETGYYTNNTVEYEEEFIWRISGNSIEKTMSDNSLEEIYFNSVPANGSIVNVYNNNSYNESSYEDVHDYNDNTYASISNYRDTILNVSMFNNISYKLNPNDNSGYVNFTLNSDGTGIETGYYSNDTQEYNENITWKVFDNQLLITLEDDNQDIYLFTEALTNNSDITVNVSDEHPFTATIENLIQNP